MLEFFTALWIDYKVQDHSMQSIIWFETYGECERVLRSGNLEIIYKNKRDVAIGCAQSDTISKSPRPKLRPE